MNCVHCAASLPEGVGASQPLCADCAEDLPAATVDPRLMADLARYWERRLMEGREKDWT